MRIAIMLALVLMMAVLGATQALNRTDTGTTVIPRSMMSDLDVNFRGSDAILLAKSIMLKVRDTHTLYPAYSMPLYNDRTVKIISAAQSFELLARTLVPWYETGACPDMVTITIPTVAPPALQPLLEPPTEGDTHAVRTEEIYLVVLKMLPIIAKMKTLPDSFVLGKTPQTQYKFTTAQMITAMAAVLQDANESMELPRTVEAPLVKSPKYWNVLDSPLAIKRPRPPVETVTLQLPGIVPDNRGPVLPFVDESLPIYMTWARPKQPMATIAIPEQENLDSVYNWKKSSPGFFAADAADYFSKGNSTSNALQQRLDYDTIGPSLHPPFKMVKLPVTPQFYATWHPAVPGKTAEVIADAPVLQLPPRRVVSRMVNPSTADITVLLNGQEVTLPFLEGRWLGDLYSGKISVEIRPQGDLRLAQIRIDNNAWYLMSGDQTNTADYNTQLIRDGWHSMTMSAVDKSGRGINHTVYFQVRNGKTSNNITKPEAADDGA